MILWLLNSWISYVVHAVLIAGIVGTFFGSIVAKIPGIGNYGTIVKTIAMPLFVIAVFAEGYLFASTSWIEEAKKFEEKVKIAEKQSQETNVKLGQALADKNNSVKQQQIVIQEKIKEVEVKVNAECKIAPDVVKILNDAAKLK